MNMSDVAAQMLSIFVSAIGLVIFRLIAKYLPDDPPPVPRETLIPPVAGKARPESEEDHG
ncbi:MULTISPECIES: hypothetical protein [unclassified Streptomyces]|uniref:hypothetical protein n=1 Tax=unclassified Streptomyces TaxID=2593676 RepID=UPI002E2A1336|nr:hypothetical protein [Streptomyces sp. NBC_00285]